MVGCAHREISVLAIEARWRNVLFKMCYSSVRGGNVDVLNTTDKSYGKTVFDA